MERIFINKKTYQFRKSKKTLDENYLELDESKFLIVRNIKKQILKCKYKLSATDYKAIKYAEGLYTEEEYASIKAERQALRDEINILTTQLEGEL